MQADELVVPSLAGKLTNVSQWACEWLRETYTARYASELVGAMQVQPTKRICISRSQSHYRAILNEEDAIAMLEARGFLCVEPYRLSFAEQVRLFAQAEAVVWLHGAGLTNAVF